METQVLGYTPELGRRLELLKDFNPRSDVSNVSYGQGQPSGHPMLPVSSAFATRNRISVFNDTVIDIPQYSLLKIGDVMENSIYSVYADKLTFKVSLPALGEKCNLCVNDRKIPAGQGGEVFVSGIVFVRKVYGSEVVYPSSGMAMCIPDGNGSLKTDNGNDGYIQAVSDLQNSKDGILGHMVMLGGGGSPPEAAGDKGTFDVQFATQENEGETTTVIRCFNSGNPSSQYAGVLHAGYSSVNVSVAEFARSEGYVFLDVTVNMSDEIVAELKFASYLPAGGDQRYIKAIAQVAIVYGGWRISRRCPIGDVEVVGRWV